MKKVLGLDLGTGSIGWAYILEAENENEESRIQRMGVRIIPQGDEKNEFEQGNAISKNAGRRDKRSARRNNQRFKLRRACLLDELKKSGIPFPVKTPETHKIFAVRERALTERIELEELGMVFLNLSKKRGYKSNRKANAEESTDSEYLTKIKENNDNLEKNFKTIGELQNNLICKSPNVQIRNKVYLRKKYIEEFDQIWEKQKEYYPDILTEEKYKKIRNEIIYYQRRLKSQKHLVTQCYFEKHHKAAPKSSPLFQIFRIYQELNNLRITHKNGTVLELTDEEKKHLFELLQKTKDLRARKILSTLKLKPLADYALNYEKIEGDQTRIKLLKVIETEELDKFTFDPLIEDYEKQEYYKLWHLLYSSENMEALVENLINKYGFSYEKAVQLSGISFKSEYGRLSSRAIRKILPEMLKGKKYSEACEMVGYNHSLLPDAERTLKEKLDILPQNSLRNPVVEKIVNQTINLVNAIIDETELGRPDEIRVELARELKAGIKERKKTFANNKQNKAENDKIKKSLENEYNVKHVSKNDILKYKLWEECDRISPYSGKCIGISDLFNGSYDIEHIIPKARIFDDSFLNKTLCENNLNREKGNDTAYDYMNGKSERELHAYIERIKNYKNMHKSKKEKLLMKAQDIPDDFIERQLRETQYISKKVKELLTQVCYKVTSTTGSVTDFLRHSWGADDILKTLNFEKYEKLGEVKEKELKDGKKIKIIDNWSKRDDHRHHAVDALIVAFTKPSYINRLNRLNQFVGDQTELKKRGRKIDPPVKHFVSRASEATEKILISFKQNNKVVTKKINRYKKANGEMNEQTTFVPRGQLHKESVFGKIKQYKVVKLNSRFKDVELIVDNQTREKVRARLEEHNYDSKSAFKNYKKNPIWKDELRSIPLEEVTVFCDKYVIRKPVDKDLKPDKVVDAGIRKILKTRLAQFNNNSQKAFSGLEENPIYLHEEKRIAIKNVRIFDGAEKLQALHTRENGEPVDFVYTRNNHHIALYENSDGEIFEEAVTFWEAVERRLNKISVVSKVKDNCRFITAMHINDLYVMGLDPQELDFTSSENYSLISKNLYRVQKLSSKYYVFRHHLESGIQREEYPFMISVFSLGEGKTGWKKFKPVKVKVNRLNRIIGVGDD